MRKDSETFYKKHPLYHIWWTMKARCSYKKGAKYKDYGGRGINVCKEWLVYQNFENDMLPTYKKGLSIDRIDNNGNYSKENCRWATMKEQTNNTRRNRLLTFNGESKTITDWSELLGIKKHTIEQRFYAYNWSIERCLTVK